MTVLASSPMIALQELGRIVQETRTARELTLRQAGAEMGVSYSTICRVENGSLPRAAELVRFATWLHISIVVAPRK